MLHVGELHTASPLPHLYLVLGGALQEEIYLRLIERLHKETLLLTLERTGRSILRDHLLTRHQIICAAHISPQFYEVPDSETIAQMFG
jgi:hypothetical protein